VKGGGRGEGGLVHAYIRKTQEKKRGLVSELG